MKSFKKIFFNFLKIFAIIISIIFALILPFFRFLSDFGNKKYECGYIDACVDFYHGELKYDLVENKDGTRTWQKVEKSKLKKFDPRYIPNDKR